MKTSSPSRLFFCSALLLATLPWGTAQAEEKKDSPKQRLRSLEKELEQAHDKLHEAQRELAKKGERIEDLEKDLAASRQSKAGTPPPKQASEKRPESKKEMTKKGQEKPVPPSKPSARLFTIAYEKNSAANYEGRDAALSWVKEQLKRDPKLALRITASANDSPYPEVNQEVADNRARYLADFLKLSGVPREALVSVEGTIAKAGGEGGRRALVSVVDRQKVQNPGKTE